MNGSASWEPSLKKGPEISIIRLLSANPNNENYWLVHEALHLSKM